MKDVWLCCFDKQSNELRYTSHNEFHGAALRLSIQNDEPVTPEEIAANPERYQLVTKIGIPNNSGGRNWVFADVVSPGIYRIARSGDLVEVEMNPHPTVEGYGECLFSRKIEGAIQ